MIHRGGIMKSIQMFIMIIVLHLGVQNVFAFGVCDDPLRDSEVCRKMHHLRSQVNLLEAQRDLMQVNYGLTNVLARDMYDLTSDLLLNNNQTGKLSNLEFVRIALAPVIEYSSASDNRALSAANQIHRQCTACHSQGNPQSGVPWSQIAQMTWGGILMKCNEEQIVFHDRATQGQTTGPVETLPKSYGEVRNPYRCKSMHGMFSNLEYFMTGYNINRVNYEMTYMAAGEIARIASDLEAHRMVHENDNDLLGNIYAMATELQLAAQNRDPSTGQRGNNLSSNCLRCHSTSGAAPGQLLNSF